MFDKSMTRFILLFGSIWTFVSSVIVILFFFLHKSMGNSFGLWVLILPLIFLVVGLVLISIVLYRTMFDKIAEKRGSESIGCVLKVSPSSWYSNGQRDLDIRLAYMDPNDTIVEKTVMSSMQNVPVSAGDFVKVKYFKDKVRIMRRESNESISETELGKLNCYFEQHGEKIKYLKNASGENNEMECMTCKNCGAPLDDWHWKCSYCGYTNI